MRSRSWELFALVLSLGVASIAACADDDEEGGVALAPDAAVGAGPAGTPAARADFGLETRPVNTTCVAPPRPPAASGVKLEPAFAGVTLKDPMALAQPPGDRTRWFAAQREGLVVSFPAANPPAAPTVVADVRQLSGKPVHTDLEGGFLSFAFHPKFAQNGRLYVSFTTDGSAGGYGSEVGYLTSTNNGASFTAYTRVLLFDRTKLEHCGGGIAFGNEGLLYLSFGDGTVVTNAQSKNNFFGKVLRIDVDNAPPGKTYGIPEGNPLKAGGGEPAVYAWGFRNPFRLSVDRGTGNVWVGDVGDASYDEIDKVELGANYGWPCREGLHDHPNEDPKACPEPNLPFVDPVVEHAHAPTPNSRSIIGGVVYRGAAMPAFEGQYVYGDLIRLEAWSLSFDAATGAATPALINEAGPQTGFSGFHEDVDGEIYATALFQGTVHKVVPAAPAAASTFPDRLSRTGCVDPADARKPAAGLVPYDLNAALWSDGADKERFIALPEGKTIGIGPDGDFDFPIGTVIVKTFLLAGRRVETRLFIRHEDGDWAGYSYEWNEEQTDAVLLPAGKTRLVGERIWTFPSRSDCKRCHTAAAGHTLGPEIAQLNRDFVYGSTNRVANQLRTLEHIQMFAAPLGKPAAELPAYPAPAGNAPLDARARAYLHANCANCHRPSGGAGRANMDLRFATPLAETKTCGVAPGLGDLGVAGAALLAPSAPEKSVISLRMRSANARRMPPIATRVVHEDGANLIDEWIRSVKVCP